MCCNQTLDFLPLIDYNLSARGLPQGGFRKGASARGLPQGGFRKGASARGLPQGGFRKGASARGLPQGGFRKGASARGLPQGGFRKGASARGLPQGGFRKGASARGLPQGGFRKGASARERGVSMKANIILIFSCLFVLFLATAAQASGFTGNTCYEEGANCQSEAEWKAGWCEAAVAAGVFEGTAEQCVQPGGGGGRLVESPQNQNSDKDANSSGQSGSDAQNQGSSGSQRQSSGDAQGQASSADAEDALNSAPSSERRCWAYKVHRSDPTKEICVTRNDLRQ